MTSWHPWIIMDVNSGLSETIWTVLWILCESYVNPLWILCEISSNLESGARLANPLATTATVPEAGLGIGPSRKNVRGNLHRETTFPAVFSLRDSHRIHIGFHRGKASGNSQKSVRFLRKKKIYEKSCKMQQQLCKPHEGAPRMVRSKFGDIWMQKFSKIDEKWFQSYHHFIK